MHYRSSCPSSEAEFIHVIGWTYVSCVAAWIAGFEESIISGKKSKRESLSGPGIPYRGISALSFSQRESLKIFKQVRFLTLIRSDFLKNHCDSRAKMDQTGRDQIGV